MKKYFLFDLDGTLTDTGPGITACVQHALTQLGWPPQSPQFLRQFVGPPLTESFQEFCGIADPTEAIRLYRERYWAWGVYQSPLYPGAEEMLHILFQAGLGLCVATSKNEQGARQILAMRGIEGLFPVVVGDDGTRPDKAAVITEVLRRLGGPPVEQAVMIGDRRYDIEGAKACGVEAIGARYGYAAPGELEEAGAAWLADSPKELGELCLELAGKE